MLKEQLFRRQVDDLGRIVIPKDIRHQANIKPKDYFNIYCENRIIKIEKDECQDHLEYINNKIAYAIHNNFSNEIIVTDKEKIICTYGKSVKKYLNHSISLEIKQMLDEEHLATSKGNNLHIIENEEINNTYFYLPIKDNYYNIGGIFILANKNNNFDKKLINFICEIVNN